MLVYKHFGLSVEVELISSVQFPDETTFGCRFERSYLLLEDLVVPLKLLVVGMP